MSGPRNECAAPAALQATLHDLARDVRRFLLPHWARWQLEHGTAPPAPLSGNTCGRSSLLLREVLRLEDLRAEWRNGVPRPCAQGQAWTRHGFFTGHGWQGHAWVECEGFIVDITADQFGARPVEVSAAPDPRYAANDIDTARPEAIRRRQETVRALLPAWLAHRARRGVHGTHAPRRATSP